MGTITERPRKDGTSTFLAQIVIKRGGKIVHRENQTHPSRKKAAAWIARREDELAKPGALNEPDNPTLAEVIDQYISTSRRAIGRTKAQVLGALKGYNIASQRCNTITSADVIKLAEQLSDGRQPQTVGNYLSHLATVFAIAKPAWGYPLDPQAVRDAMVVGKRLGVTGKSRERDRRPTLDELDRLMTHFGSIRARRPTTAPMQALVAFAIYSTRRQEEITRLAWEDLDEEHGRILVRDMKHPGDKLGNDQWLDMTPEALAIAQAQPRTGPLIFPYSTDAISAAFTRACHVLAIEDLHFHDMRHHGISRLFEMGWNIPHAAAVSGHRSWSSLKRYTHIRQRGDCMAGWRWLDVVTKKKPGE